MFSPPAPDPRRRGPRGSAPLAFIRSVLVAASLVGLRGAGTARAQWEPILLGTAWAQGAPAIVPIAHRALHPIVHRVLHGDSKCRLYGKFIPIQYESFLYAANESGFIREFEQALSLLAAWEDREGLNPRNPGYAVIRVTAPPGYGKSALFRYLRDILDPALRRPGPGGGIGGWFRRVEDALDPPPGGEKIGGTEPDRIRKTLEHKENLRKNIFWINLDEIEKHFEIRSTRLDDLKDHGGSAFPAFGRLPAFDYDDHSAPDVEQLVRAFNPDYKDPKLERSILIIDSIDEIHPESAKSLLTRIDEYIKQRKEKDERILEREAIEREKRRENPAGAGGARTRRGFLRVFVFGRPEGFTDYYRVTQGGAPKRAPIRLRDPFYNRDPDGDRRAAVESVVRFLDPGADFHDIYMITNEIIKFTESHGHEWSREMLHSLSGINDLARFSAHPVPPHLANDEFALKDIFFQAILDRARDSHHRPVARSQDYVRLLEEVARRFAGPDRVDGGGYFVVSPGDTVEIEVEWDGQTRKVSYLVESVLNRSGLVDIESVDRFPRYRFFPNWLRDHLRERYLRRK